MRKMGIMFPNWRLFGEMSPEDLAEGGRHATSDPWIQQGYRWFYDRLPPSIAEKYKRPLEVPPAGPPSQYVPFPISVPSSECNFNAGGIAFLSVDSNGSLDAGNSEQENDSIKRAAHDAAAYVYGLFRRLQPQIGFPRVEILAQPAEGRSLSLAAMIASLCQILHVVYPDTLLATGCFQENRLQTVGEDTLWQKTVAAVRYGYQKFFLVEGQKGTWGNVSMSPEELLKTLQKEGILPQDTALQFIEVPQDPLKAIFRILQEMPDGTDKEMAILLTAFSEKFLHSDFINGLDDFLSTVHPFTQSRSPLIRHVALDILCRRELHLGNTPQADIYRRETPPLRPSEFPPGRLGCYIKYEEAASKAILDLDLGYWDSDHPDHQLLERLLERLKASVADQRVDIEELRNAMAMANTKGKRLLFLGRLSEDAKLLEQAWNEFVYFQEYWGEIFEYTAKENLYNETPQRQRNQCVECLTDYWSLTRKVLPCPKLPLEDPVEKANSYDLVAELSQSVTHEVPISLATFFEKADSDYENWKGYPCFLPYEKVLIYGIGSASDQEHARQQLKQAFHLKDPSVRSGILALLGMRSAFVLDDLDLMNQIYREIARDNPLKKIADTLMENPAKITFRCPY